MMYVVLCSAWTHCVRLFCGGDSLKWQPKLIFVTVFLLAHASRQAYRKAISFMPKLTPGTKMRVAPNHLQAYTKLASLLNEEKNYVEAIKVEKIACLIVVCLTLRVSHLWYSFLDTCLCTYLMIVSLGKQEVLDRFLFQFFSPKLVSVLLYLTGIVALEIDGFNNRQTVRSCLDLNRVNLYSMLHVLRTKNSPFWLNNLCVCFQVFKSGLSVDRMNAETYNGYGEALRELGR